jgi:imidazolonepropionase-like amidohydrolase
VTGGVDIIAHIPGGRSTNPAPFLLTDDDAKQAAARNITVITTVAQQRDSAITDQLLASQLGPNITVLRRNGVKLVIGSDLFPATAAVEIAALMRSKLFTNLELLRLWSVATPQLIFPQRRIGEFREGFEASFLVLRGDPLSDFRNTTGITMRVKRGRLLAPARPG